MQDLIFPKEESFGDGAFRDLIRYIIDGSKKLGKDFQSVKNYEAIMQEKGFEDIHALYFTWPMRRLKEEFYMIARLIQYELCESSLLDFETMISEAESELDGDIQGDIQM